MVLQKSNIFYLTTSFQHQAAVANKLKAKVFFVSA